MKQTLKMLSFTFLFIICSHAFAQAHKNKPSDTKCVWCDEAEYGVCKKSISKPKRHEHKTEDTACRWCGSDKYGLGCHYCPYRSKVHEHGPVISKQTKTMISMRNIECLYHKKIEKAFCDCSVQKCKWCGIIFRNYYKYMMDTSNKSAISIKWGFCPNNPTKPEKRMRNNPLCKGIHEE